MRPLAVLVVALAGLIFPRVGQAKPLKVFILAGQSNMQGHAQISTFDSLASDPKTAPLLEMMRTPDGKPKVSERVWVSSIGCLGDAYSDLNEQTGRLTAGFGAFGPEGERIGPEFLFGLTMEQQLNEPILIIKTSWGGRSLHSDFRPPSAGPETPNDYTLKQWKERGLDVAEETDKMRMNSGVFYRHMMEHVRKVLADIPRVVPGHDPQDGYELAGFVWFQGFNDYVDSWTYPQQNEPRGYDLYGELLAHFIRDVRKDLQSPELPFVIGVMGIDGMAANQKAPQMHFRNAQRSPSQLPEFQGNVFAVETAPFWDDDLDQLKQRLDAVNDRLEQEFRKQPKLSEEKKEAARKQAAEEHFQPEELQRLRAGVSNGGYHYLGAAKILAPIGKAFAEAILSKDNPPPQARFRRQPPLARELAGDLLVP